MARTWSNTKRIPSYNAAQQAQAAHPKRPSTFGILMVVIAVWFLGLIAFTMYHVTVHPINALPHVNVQEPKED